MILEGSRCDSSYDSRRFLDIILDVIPRFELRKYEHCSV